LIEVNPSHNVHAISHPYRHALGSRSSSQCEAVSLNGTSRIDLSES